MRPPSSLQERAARWRMNLVEGVVPPFDGSALALEASQMQAPPQTAGRRLADFLTDLLVALDGARREMMTCDDARRLSVEDDPDLERAFVARSLIVYAMVPHVRTVDVARLMNRSTRRTQFDRFVWERWSARSPEIDALTDRICDHVDLLAQLERDIETALDLAVLEARRDRAEERAARRGRG